MFQVATLKPKRKEMSIGIAKGDPLEFQLYNIGPGTVRVQLDKSEKPFADLLPNDTVFVAGTWITLELIDGKRSKICYLLQ